MVARRDLGSHAPLPQGHAAPAAGRPAALHRYAEMPHAFVQLPVAATEEAIDVASAFLRGVLGSSCGD
jgi:acetyl esterase/lipase